MWPQAVNLMPGEAEEEGCLFPYKPKSPNPIGAGQLIFCSDTRSISTATLARARQHGISSHDRRSYHTFRSDTHCFQIHSAKSSGSSFRLPTCTCAGSGAPQACSSSHLLDTALRTHIGLAANLHSTLGLHSACDTVHAASSPQSCTLVAGSTHAGAGTSLDLGCISSCLDLGTARSASCRPLVALRFLIRTPAPAGHLPSLTQE